jgi:hypothetical protein
MITLNIRRLPTGWAWSICYDGREFGFIGAASGGVGFSTPGGARQSAYEAGWRVALSGQAYHQWH